MANRKCAFGVEPAIAFVLIFVKDWDYLGGGNERRVSFCE